MPMSEPTLLQVTAESTLGLRQLKNQDQKRQAKRWPWISKRRSAPKPESGLQIIQYSIVYMILWYLFNICIYIIKYVYIYILYMSTTIYILYTLILQSTLIHVTSVYAGENQLAFLSRAMSLKDILSIHRGTLGHLRWRPCLAARHLSNPRVHQLSRFLSGPDSFFLPVYRTYQEDLMFIWPVPERFTYVLPSGN